MPTLVQRLPKGKFYCGPAAIAAFTGKHPKEDVRTWINRIRHRPDNRGVCCMSLNEMELVLRRQGFCVKRTSFTPAKPDRMGATAGDWRIWREKKKGAEPTLLRFAKDHPCGAFVVNVTGHFVAYCDGMAMDSRTPYPVAISLFNGRRAKVQHVLELT